MVCKQDFEKGYAGFFIRLLSILLDYAIVAIPVALASLLIVVFLLVSEFSLSPSAKELLKQLPILFMVVALTLYFSILNSGGKQATIGKRLCAIYIGSAYGGSGLSFSKAFVRSLFVILIVVFSYASKRTNSSVSEILLRLFYILLLLENLFIFFSKERAAAHDLLLNTRVFKHSSAESLHNYVYICILLLTIVLLYGALIPLFMNKVLYLSVWLVLSCFLFIFIIIKLRLRGIMNISIEEKRGLKLLFQSLMPTILLYGIVWFVVIYYKVMG